MNTRFTKLLSLVLAVMLLVSVTPTSIFAVTTDAITTTTANQAKIDDTEYATLAEAVKAVEKGAPETTITLLADAKISSLMVGHQYVQNVVLDLNGYTLSSNAIVLTAYRAGTTLTIKNGTVQGNSTSGSLRATYGGKLILGEDLTVACAGGSATAVYVDNGTLEVKANSVTMPSGKASICVSDNANNKVTLYGGTYKTEPKAEWLAENYEVTENEDGTFSVTYKYPAVIGETNYETLAKAIADAKDGDTVTLMADYSNYKMIQIGKSITLDLNGYTINRTFGGIALDITDGVVTIVGGGKISGSTTAIAVAYDAELILKDVTAEGRDGHGVDNDGKLTVDGATITATEYGVALFSGEEYAASVTVESGSISGAYGIAAYANTTVTINGGKISGTTAALSGEGGSHGTKFYVNGGELFSESGVGIYHPQNGTLNVTGGTISGATGINVKSGTVNISGGKILGTGAQADYSFVGGGFNATGDALVIESCKYPGGVPVVNVTGGIFESTYANALASYAGNGVTETVGGFVAGGTFSTPVAQAFCAEGYTPNTNADGTFGVVEGSYVATINGKGYESLQEAVNAANDGDVIIVVADHELVATGVAVDGLPVLVAVDGKSVTIDLNGKKITGTSGATNLTYYAAFAVDNDGSLTLTDSVGTGAVEITGESTMYSLLMAYEYGANKATKLIVEGGSYYLEYAHDCLIFCGEKADDLVYIEGGNFKLGNVGVGENGKPWIFNVSGTADGSANVTGGTFNADVNRQHWSGEVYVAKECYTVDNGDGTYTVNPGAAAYVYTGMLSGPYYMPKNIGYATLEEAIAAALAKGDKLVTLLKDVTMKAEIATINTEAGQAYTGIQIPAELTLDGDGYTLTVTGADDHTWSSAVYMTGGTLKNLTIVGGKRGVLVNCPTEDIVLENVSVSQSTYALNTNSAGPNGTVKLTVKNSTFNGWTSISNVSISGATFENCHFGMSNRGEGKTDYAYFRPYCATTITGAETTFSQGYTIDGNQAVTTITGVDAAQIANIVAEEGCVIETVNGVTTISNKAYTAQIGETGYETLAEAIAAAKDGDTIVLVNDIALTAKDLSEYDGYNTFFNVSGKTITLDLNGKTITADVSEAQLDAFILGVFCTTNNGHLTIKGEGAVTGISGATQEQAYLDASKGNADYNYKFYSLLITYGDDCSITIDGGDYSLDYAGDSLAYTSCNEGLVINGGSFQVGNLGGIRNGMPWTFNARGQNVRHVLVTGGTFYADILHQYYPFEVYMAKELALQKGENGSYTVVPAVAYVTEREWSSAWYTNEIGYATLQEAIDACEGTKTRGNRTSAQEIVVLLTDVELTDTLTIAADKSVVLDLNGHTVSQTKECNGHYAMVVNNGSLTIQDMSSRGGAIRFTDTGAGDSNFGWGSYTISNNGTLVVESGVIENLSAQNSANSVVHMYCAIQQGNDSASTTIKGGTISTPTYRSIRINRGSLTITGGVFEGQIWAQPFAASVSITISGGRFAPRGADGSSLYIDNEKYDVALSVTGGEFSTKIGCANASKLPGCITGGQFTEDAAAKTDEKLFAENMKSTDNQ